MIWTELSKFLPKNSYRNYCWGRKYKMYELWHITTASSWLFSRNFLSIPLCWILFPALPTVMVVIRISKRQNIIKASECMEGENVRQKFVKIFFDYKCFFLLKYWISEKTYKIHLRSAILFYIILYAIPLRPWRI